MARRQLTYAYLRVLRFTSVEISPFDLSIRTRITDQGKHIDEACH
jgi:hypothetical protein